MKTYAMSVLRLAVLAWMFGASLLAGEAGAGGGETKPVPEAMVPCPQCDATGEMKCAVTGCRKGKAPCARTCLKKSEAWERMKVDGHPEAEMWVKVYTADKSTFVTFPQKNMGHLIENDAGGVPRDKGVCPDCKGTGVSTCAVCKGTALVPCTMCQGSKEVASSVAKEFIAKRDKARAASAITLTDGTVIYGKVVMRTPTTVTVKTDDGKTIDVPAEKMPPAETKKPDSKPSPEPKK